MPALSDRRLLFVTGKGGVGKSTVAAALGVAAARRGLRTLVAELGGQGRVAALLGADGASPDDDRAADGERALDERLHATAIDPRAALDEYLALRAGPLGDVLAGSRTFHGFVAATPGMRELLAVGKAWELAQPRRRTPGAAPYDLVIVDAPASGHGLGERRTRRTFAEIAKVGPIASQGRQLDASLTDPAFTAVVAVALAEETPVNETLALRARLRDELGIELAATVVNALVPDRFGPRQAQTVARALDGAGADASPLVRAALAAARSEHRRASAQRAQLRRLADGLGAAPLELPYLFTPTVDRAALDALADRLDALL